jgi:hypothetical protein
MDLSTAKRWICGPEYSENWNMFQRSPHRISADINILTSAHTGFADVDCFTSAHQTPQNGVSLCASKACKRKRTPCPSVQIPHVEHLSNITPHCHPPYPPDSQAAAEQEQARKKKAEEDQAKEKVQALLAHEDAQYKDTRREMRCGR